MGAALLILTCPALAGIVVVSGGGSPWSNHYSQYLQTRSLTHGLRERFGTDAVSVAFGVGNQPLASPILADVIKEDSFTDYGESLNYRKFIVGALEGNHEANRTEIQSLLKKQSSPQEPLFLIISDHGSPNDSVVDLNYDNNCITLWGTDAKTLQERTEFETCYSREDLEEDLLKNHPRRVIYGMSQCYSGGFHRLSIKTDDEFRVQANPNICGFAASPADLPASGCSDSVDGPRYAGYERYFTSQILGADFVNSVPTGFGPAKNLREAHLRAALQDFTIDIPNSTSDFYLLELARSAQQRGLNSNFPINTRNRHLRGRIEFFSNPQKGSAFLSESSKDQTSPAPNSMAYAPLYVDRVKHLESWASAAQGAGLEDASALLEKPSRHTLKRIDSLYQAYKEILKDRNPLERESLQIEAVLTLETDLLSQTRASLIEDLGLQAPLSKYEDEMIKMAPLISTSDPYTGDRIQIFSKLWSHRFWNPESSPTDSTTQSRLQRYHEIEIQVREKDERIKSIQKQAHWLRNLYQMKQELGVLGAAIENGAISVLENYQALVDCETTPL